MQRASAHASGGYASGIAAKMWPWLKNHSETDSETSANRSTVRRPNGLRQSTSPSRNSAQNESHSQGSLIFAPPNAPFVPARHPPRDLRAGQRLGDLAARVVDRSLRDLARRARPHVHGPVAEAVRRVGLGLRRIPLQPVADLRVREEARDHLGLLRDAAARPTGPTASAERVRGRRRRARASRRHERQRRDRNRDRPQPRNDQSLFPMKFSGVTSMIATICDTVFPHPSQSRNTNSQN